MEDKLQKAAYKLNQIITGHGLAVSVEKTKLMAFKGRDPFRSKIVIGNKIKEQINSFNYVENLISNVKEVEVCNKLNNYFNL